MEKVVQKAYVFSVAPYVALKAVMPYGGTYHIEAKGPGQRYSVTPILASRYTKDYGQAQYEHFPVGADELAKDLLRNVEDQGVWFGLEETPTESEIAAAEAKQRQFYEKHIQEADGLWARFRDPKRIPMHAFLGARELNIRRDWANDISSMEQCKGCRELISKDAAKCGKCGAILNGKAAYELGMIDKSFAIERGWLDEKPEAARRAAK